MSKMMLAFSGFVASVVSAHAMQDEPPEEVLTPEQIIENAPESSWRSLDPENTLYLQLPAGMVIIEMRPDLAPAHVAQIRQLVREGFYDGLNFHRVIEGFMAQGGDPKGDGTGESHLPDIKGEFLRDTSESNEFVAIGRDRIAPRIGYDNGLPMGAQPESLRAFTNASSVQIWPLHCPGVMSMARATNPDSANSQFFLMIGDSRLNLDKRYTVWGRIVDGFEATRRIARGEPPARATPIMRMRMEDSVSGEDRKKVEILRTDSETFMRYLKARGDVDETGFVKEICDITIPTRVNGKIER